MPIWESAKNIKAILWRNRRINQQQNLKSYTWLWSLFHRITVSPPAYLIIGKSSPRRNNEWIRCSYRSRNYSRREGSLEIRKTGWYWIWITGDRRRNTDMAHLACPRRNMSGPDMTQSATESIHSSFQKYRGVYQQTSETELWRRNRH